jgi:hypothetical protein
MVAREIVLEKKRVCVPTSMIQEPLFELPVLVAPTVRDTVVQTPIVSSSIDFPIIPIVTNAILNHGVP